MHHDRLFLWQAKLAAWLHDPPEKALILGRTREGHEGGTVAGLKQLCFGDERLSRELRWLAKLGDTWAAASDRPQWPNPKEDRSLGQRVYVWSRDGAVFVHPLGGDQYHLSDLYVTAAGRLVAASEEKMRALLTAATQGVDVIDSVEVQEDVLRELAVPVDFLDSLLPAEPGKEEEVTLRAVRLAVLALWRLGPLFDPSGLNLGSVWRLLPADSRVCDHSIWEHNALASAFAGSLAADPAKNPALLVVSLGPVQGFIEQARSSSDLWAGSHLLSCLAWQAMRPIVEALGPDAVLFPSLWGVPLVDVWLEEQGLALPGREEGERCPTWKRSPTDSNPLFSPSLPNRFLALVPAASAVELAEAAKKAVQGWAREQAQKTLEYLAELVGQQPTSEAYQQVARQLADFPEVYWAVVPFRELLAPKGPWPDADVK